MNSNSLFATYSQKENQVTSTILSVLERLDNIALSEFIGRLTGEPEKDVPLAFDNQFTDKSGDSVPDASIRGLSHILFETKVARNAVGERQVRDHLKEFEPYRQLEEEKQMPIYRKLILLTPDNESPIENLELDEKEKEEVSWCSFKELNDIIDGILDGHQTMGQRAELLLRDLQEFVHDRGLIPYDPRELALIVPAKAAWPDYKEKELYGYFCQPERSFKEVGYIGFYHQNQIEHLFPRVLGVIDSIVLDNHSEEDLKKYLKKPSEGSEEDLFEYTDPMQEDDEELRKELIDRLLELKGNDRFFQKHQNHKIFILSEPDDDRTIKRNSIIENDKLSRNGTRTAFVQMQRYLKIGDLQDEKVKKTSQLEEG